MRKLLIAAAMLIAFTVPAMSQNCGIVIDSAEGAIERANDAIRAGTIQGQMLVSAEAAAFGHDARIRVPKLHAVGIVHTSDEGTLLVVLFTDDNDNIVVCTGKPDARGRAAIRKHFGVDA